MAAAITTAVAGIMAVVDTTAPPVIMAEVDTITPPAVMAALHHQARRGHHAHRGHGHHHSHARRFWRGHWYAYGVGSCWRWSNYYDEFVWVCR